MPRRNFRKRNYRKRPVGNIKYLNNRVVAGKVPFTRQPQIYNVRLYVRLSLRMGTGATNSAVTISNVGTSSDDNRSWSLMPAEMDNVFGTGSALNRFPDYNNIFANYRVNAAGIKYIPEVGDDYRISSSAFVSPQTVTVAYVHSTQRNPTVAAGTSGITDVASCNRARSFALNKRFHYRVNCMKQPALRRAFGKENSNAGYGNTLFPSIVIASDNGTTDTEYGQVICYADLTFKGKNSPDLD